MSYDYLHLADEETGSDSYRRLAQILKSSQSHSQARWGLILVVCPKAQRERLNRGKLKLETRHSDLEGHACPTHQAFPPHPTFSH